MTSQDKFEAWAVEHLPHLYLTKTDEGTYASPITRTCFVGWSARDGEVEGLTEESASLRGSCKALGKDLTTAVRACKKATKERDKLRAECESLRKDAERYRWLRRQIENCAWMAGVSTIVDTWGNVDEERVNGADDLDHTIDAAMSKEASHD